MKKLRLLLWEDCNRKCVGCCNNDWDLNSLERETDFSQYDKILMTGGEPMLNIGSIIGAIEKIKETSVAKLYLYTAKVNDFGEVITVLQHLDGLTVTLHEQQDVEDFESLCDKFNYLPIIQSLRVNIFKDIELSPDIDLSKWIVKDNIEWIKNAPLPEDEVFKRY